MSVCLLVLNVHQVSSTELCIIHGKALEENAGLEAMLNGHRVVDATRLLWEILKSPEGGRLDEYRHVWVGDCAFPAELFDKTLARLPEPTSAKWQVMAQVCTVLEPLLDPVRTAAGAVLNRTYIERFIEECVSLNMGSTDESKPSKIAHPHTEKVMQLGGE